MTMTMPMPIRLCHHLTSPRSRSRESSHQLLVNTETIASARAKMYGDCFEKLVAITTNYELQNKLNGVLRWSQEMVCFLSRTRPSNPPTTQSSFHPWHPLPYHHLITLFHLHARPALQSPSLLIELLAPLSGHSIMPSAHSLECGYASPTPRDPSRTEGCAA